jgi:hypothetical protein
MERVERGEDRLGLIRDSAPNDPLVEIRGSR